MLARVNTGNETLIRYNRPFSYNGIPYSALLTAALSNHLINAAGPLSNLYTYYIELDFYKHNIIIYFTMILAIISFPLLLVIILLALYISESITRPILAIENASQSIMEGDLSVRIIEKENRDFNKIINSFNKMLSTVERKNEEKYESTHPYPAGYDHRFCLLPPALFRHSPVPGEPAPTALQHGRQLGRGAVRQRGRSGRGGNRRLLPGGHKARPYERIEGGAVGAAFMAARAAASDAPSPGAISPDV